MVVVGSTALMTRARAFVTTTASSTYASQVHVVASPKWTREFVSLHSLTASATHERAVLPHLDHPGISLANTDLFPLPQRFSLLI